MNKNVFPKPFDRSYKSTSLNHTDPLDPTTLQGDYLLSVKAGNCFTVCRNTS